MHCPPHSNLLPPAPGQLPKWKAGRAGQRPEQRGGAWEQSWHLRKVLQAQVQLQCLMRCAPALTEGGRAGPQKLEQ